VFLFLYFLFSSSELLAHMVELIVYSRSTSSLPVCMR